MCDSNDSAQTKAETTASMEGDMVRENDSFAEKQKQPLNATCRNNKKKTSLKPEAQRQPNIQVAAHVAAKHMHIATRHDGNNHTRTTATVMPSPQKHRFGNVHITACDGNTPNMSLDLATSHTNTCDTQHHCANVATSDLVGT